MGTRDAQKLLDVGGLPGLMVLNRVPVDGEQEAIVVLDAPPQLEAFETLHVLEERSGPADGLQKPSGSIVSK